MESTTARPSAVKRYRLAPERKMTGKNTTEVVSVAASTGSATSLPPFSAASLGDSPCSMWRKMFSSTTTESSIRREKPSASPPRIIVLIVPPPRERQMNMASAESGMERNTATVARMLPRKIRIRIPVSTRPIPPSCMRLSMAFLTKSDWSNTTFVISCFGTSTSSFSTLFTPSTTAIVLESPPCFSTGWQAERWPSTRTMLVCSWEASMASPTSPTMTDDWPTVFSGMRLISSIVSTCVLA